MDWSKWETSYTDGDKAELGDVLLRCLWAVQFRRPIGPEGVYVDSIKVMAPKELAGDWLVVIAVWLPDGQPAVGYCSGSQALIALVKGLSRLVDGQLEWRKDKFRSARD